MQKSRYMIVSHSKESSADKSLENGSWQNKMPVHHLVGQYHWSRIDDEHIIVKAHFDVSRHKELHSHAHVTVLPSIYSNIHVGDFIDKQHEEHKVHKHHRKRKHKEAVVHIAGTHKLSIGELTEHIEAKYGPMFSPEK